MAGRALVVERVVTAEGEACRGEVERADDGAGGGGEVACVGLAELLPRHGAERLVEHPVVPALRVHLGPLRQPRHRCVRHVRRRPDCSKKAEIVQGSVSAQEELTVRIGIEGRAGTYDGARCCRWCRRPCGCRPPAACRTAPAPSSRLRRRRTQTTVKMRMKLHKMSGYD
jgi:hypothetical protein